MASDLSSGCTEVIEILDEKEEGEISLEDVSSSEEGQLNDRCNLRRRTAGQCPICLSTKQCAIWCVAPTKTNTLKSSMKKDAVQEKENCDHTKDSGYSGSKHCSSTLQENNNDLIPISSDSDMEIVGLADTVKQVLTLPQAKTTKVRKRRKKKRSQISSVTAENAAVNTATNLMPESSVIQKHDSQVLKDNHLPRLHRRESNSPHKRPGSPYNRSRIAKSPMRRHRSPIGRGRSPFIKSRSPLGHPRLPVLRKSPIRRPRSPGRRLSPHSPVKSPVRRQLRSSMSPTNTYIDMYGNVNKLLKKVRHLKTVGSLSANRNVDKLKEHRPSLKDKLNNMIKADNGSSDFTMKSNRESKFVEDDDDEEDLALLRKMALETKPKKNEKVQEDTELKESTQREINNIDEDVEDLELRMIALRSAVVKKHQDRMQRGVMVGKSKKRPPSARTNTESPFSQSFLDSIPIPDEEEKKFETPPVTPTRELNENTNPEDMELDSEVELDKEKEAEPYSPTDRISQNIPVDTELLGIHHSDVSFITPTSQITVSDNLDLQVLGSAKIKTLTGASYLPLNKMSENNVDSSKHVLPSSQSPTSSPCFPNNMTQILENNHCPQLGDYLPTTPYSPSEPITTPDIYLSPQVDSHCNSDPNHIPDTPYSPTDTPVCDFELNTTPLFSNVSHFQESDMKKSKRNRSALIHINLISTSSQDISKISNSNITENLALSPIDCPKKMVEIEKENMSQTSSMDADIGSAFNSLLNSPEDTMIEVDDLPETDLDGSPLVPMPAELRDIEIHIPDAISQEILKLSQEPLYLQGVPDVTKDANKIPTLVNKSLVPASILRSNKNLQQPLPPKKIDPHLEPAFKSAEMQPVEISTESTNSSRLFKPIKLAPVIKKPHLNMVKPSAFNFSVNDNATLEDHENSENDQPAPSQNKQAIRSSSKTRMSTDQVQQLETRSIIVETIGKLPESVSEFQTTVAQYQGHSDTLRNSKKESAKKRNGSTDVERKKESKTSKPARTKSKHTSKSLMNNKSIGTKHTVTTVANAIAPEESISPEIVLRCKQHSKSNRSGKIHSPKISAQKTRNSRNKSQKPVVQKSSRESNRRSKIQSVSNSKNERSDKKSFRLSNDLKTPSADKLNDKGMEMNHHSLTDRRKPEETKQVTQPAPMFVEPKETFIPQTRSVSIEKGNNYSSAKHSKTELGIHENTSNDSISDTVTINANVQKINDVNETIANISNTSTTCHTEGKPSASIANIHSEGSGDSILENMMCQKVEANKRRRSSIDEDEEALRAILLASLAKRSKPPEPMNTITKTTVLANLSYSSPNTSTDSVEGLPNTLAAKTSVSLVYNSSSDSTLPLSSHTSSLSNPPVKNSIPGPLSEVVTSDAVTAKSILPENVTHDQSTLSTALSRKRSISASGKGPPKKIAKKTPISASTKVVNNAKKYQNTLFQKKLNLQKTAVITNAHKTLNQISLHANKLVDGSRSRSMITNPLSETQRFVINLASDSESENETELLNKDHQELVNSNRSEQKPALSIPMSEFERSVDLFLKDVRKKQETAAAANPNSTKTAVTQKPVSPAPSTHRKSPVLSATPLAVRHLPISQQEEYRRLKQQILEREKMKLHRVLGNNSSPLSPSSKSSGTPPGPLSPASPVASPITSRQNYNAPLNSQSLMTTTSKDYKLWNISVQNNLKTTISSGKSRATSVVSKADGSTPSISNLSIQIPNETTNVKIASKKSTDLYIPVSTSQSRLVTAVKSTKDTVNTEDTHDSTVFMKGQSNLKNVHVQLQQGKTGRTVSLRGGTNLNTKLTVSNNQELQEVSPQEFTPTEISTNIEKNQTDITATSRFASSSPSMDSRKTTTAIDVSDKRDSSVDSMASTLVISREGENSKNSTLINSSASTVILSRNENSDNSKLESGNPESNNKNCGVSKSSVNEPKKLRNNKDIWEKIRGDVKKELDSISVLPSSEQKSYLANVEHNLVKKRYAILDDLSDISGNLRQLEMERDVQTRAVLEVKKLQEQLKLAEERLQAQRDRVNKMVPNIIVAYEKLNSGRRECVKMTRICLGLGCLVIGANYKIPAAGAQLLNNRLKQVAGCTRQLSKKKASLSVDRGDVPSQVHPQSSTNSIDHCLDSPAIQSPQSISQGSSKEKDDESVITISVALTEDHSNSNPEPTAAEEAEQTGVSETKTLKLQDSTTAVFLPGSVCENLPQSTSTPNPSGESYDVTKYLTDCETTMSKFVLDGPKVELIGQKDSLEQRKLLQPYKSVLTHLKVPRTTDPSGILCPYELMGTCRDEGCQFMHQSARNGNVPSEVQYAAAESIPLVAAATPRDGKLSS
ncbi:mucin-17 isoform X1 [Neodiprion lecontei]|uniref:Mucin-17 isoform X1 n=3 Tax=Neodiprion lecontei TaxID=441921 RepID=A0ABM3GIU4_NEOLC|nr:mucin-17 isoform X1 [Neodiprion lecontei]